MSVGSRARTSLTKNAHLQFSINAFATIFPGGRFTIGACCNTFKKRVLYFDQVAGLSTFPMNGTELMADRTGAEC